MTILAFIYRSIAVEGPENDHLPKFLFLTRFFSAYNGVSSIITHRDSSSKVISGQIPEYDSNTTLNQ